ncbi:uncharacterized protein LOC135815502 [Sycon ciliatum]|uniref:uncharacterized protein LOC135815502 n=1 Tax=Sycon ciliatum TaxID=27933 RepID=UPI0031F6790A
MAKMGSNFVAVAASIVVAIACTAIGLAQGFEFRVQLFRCNIHKDAATQSWLVETGAPGHNILSLRHNPSMVLEAYTGLGGAGVRLAERSNSVAQQFYYNTSKYMITSGLTGLCVAVPSGTGGVLVTLANCSNSDPNQSWAYDTMLGQMQYSQDWMLCLDAGTNVNYHTTGCGSLPYSGYAYCNHSLSAGERIKSLLGFINVGEKAQLLSAQGHTNGGIGRLAVPAYTYGECLHGVRSSCGQAAPGSTGCATSFPNPLGLAATFNRTLWSMVGDVISTEGRALYSQNRIGLSMWAPNINLFRDPRWGRGQETPGEDPFLTSEYIAHYASHLQGDEQYLKLVSTCKHFSAYDLENYATGSRKSFNAIVSDQDLVEYYWVPFKACVQKAHVKSIMCSYNSVNGIPSCANSMFQNTIAREHWGFDGFFVSDCTAIEAIYNRHNYTNSTEAAIKVAMEAGTDVNCGSVYSESLAAAVNHGAVTEDLLDQSAERLLNVGIELGLLDPPELQPYTNLSYVDVDTEYSRQVSLEAARQQIVLLQNDGNMLPLSKVNNVAVIGPLANVSTALLGNYYGANEVVKSHTVLMAMQRVLGKSQISYAQGLSSVSSTNTSGFEEAGATASSCEMSVVVIGLDSSQEDEAHDRTNISLPGAQVELVKWVFASNPKAIVVLINGGPLAIQPVLDLVPSVVEAFYPGQMGADAIAEVIFGDTVPSGRLPFTVYPDGYVQRPISDMSLRDNGGCTYQYYTGSPLFQFGHGLSYTTFSYKWSNESMARITRTTTEAANTPITYTVIVENTGPYQAPISVLAFISATDQPDAPLKKLFDFGRVYLQVEQLATIQLTVLPDVLALVDEKGVQSIRPGNYKVQIETLTGEIQLTGKEVELFSLPKIREQHQRKQPGVKAA